MRLAVVTFSLLLLSCDGCEVEPDWPTCPAGFVYDDDEASCVVEDMGPPDMPVTPDLGPCGDCGDEVCDTTSGDCVECLTEAECGGDTPLCADDNTCVACVADSDCGDPTAPQCNAGTCGDCTSDDACTERTDTPVCDEPSGDCVQCTVDSEETTCPAPDSFACDPTLLTCTGAERGTLGVCQECVSDSECLENHRCVPTTFTDDMAMTHEASYCGVEGIGDGVCRDGLCTYACLGGRDCASGDSADCIGADPTYCDPN